MGFVLECLGDFEGNCEGMEGVWMRCWKVSNSKNMSICHISIKSK